jgi:hypothetical protein
MSEDLPITPPEEGNGDSEKPSRRMAELPDGTLVVVEGKSFIENKFEYYLVDYGNGIKDKVRAHNIEFRDDMDIAEGEPKPAYSNEEVTEITPEQQQARKEIIDFLTPRIKDIQDRKENPRPGDEFMLAKLEAIVKLAHEGEFTKREKYSGINAKGEIQKGGNSVLKYFASALEFEKEGSKRFNQISGIIKSLENAGVDVSIAQKTKAEKTPDISPPKPDPDNKHPDKDQGKNKVDDTNANKNNDLEEEWLDPRYIQELKGKFEQTYAIRLKEEQERRKRLRDDSSILPSFREGIKAQIIKNAIADRKDRAEWLAGEDNFGSKRQPGFSTIEKWEVERPSDEIIRKMMENLDEPVELLNELAEKEDQRLKEKTSTAKFKPGDKVKIFNYNKSVSDGWTVKGYQQRYNPGVLVTKGKEMRWFSENKLREFQEQSDPDQDKLILESLKPYFNKLVNIRTDEGVVEGQFQGYKISNQNVYLGDKNGIRLGEVPVGDFLSWQSLKSNEEIAAEQAAKIERINREIPENERKFKLGQEVKNAIGKVIDEGWIVEDFKKDGDKVVVTIEKNGARHEVEQELLLSNQKEGAAGQKDSDTEDKGEAAEDKKDDSGSDQNKNNESKPKLKPKHSAQEQKIVDLEEKLVELKKVEIAESMWEKRWNQWKSYWKKFEEGETSREIRKNKQKKKVAQFAGVAATIGVWPVALWGGIIGVPTFMGNQKYHNALRRGHKRQIEKLERDIKEEKEELELQKQKDSDKN